MSAPGASKRFGPIRPTPEALRDAARLAARQSAGDVVYHAERLALLCSAAYSVQGFGSALGIVGKAAPEEVARRSAILADVLMDALNVEARSTFEAIAEFRGEGA